MLKLHRFWRIVFIWSKNMSAIFGAIGFWGIITSDRVLEILKKPFSTCVTDNYFEFKMN